jgi:hypothetical protein
VLPFHLRDTAEKEALIFNKQFYFFAEFPAQSVTSQDLDKIILECYEVGKPIEAFFNQFIQR